MQDAPLLAGPYEAITGPSENLYTCDSTAEDTCGPLPYPSTGTSCQILQASQLEGLWQNVHMWAVGINTSNWDSMVSHCPWEHLGVCLICSQCGLSYLDPPKFSLHGRETHNWRTFNFARIF